MNKREAVLGLLDPGSTPGYTPAAFFLHFDPMYHRGQAAVDKHLEYFRYTGMDLVKIQYERTFPHLPEIRRPADWPQMPCYGLEFYEAPLGVLAGLVKAAKPEALVIQTLYSPFMCAGQTVGAEMLADHIRQDSEGVKRGMQVITDSLLRFVKECIRLGVDGFYTSTQGGESGRFGGSPLFNECIRPYELVLMQEINRACGFNILHVCDYHLPYSDLTPFVDYPGHVVNASLELTGGKISPQAVASLFGRPYMGGLERKGVIATGSVSEVQKVVEGILRAAPERFILGADCTVPSETSWDNLKAAISTAHAYRR
ncbi:MAG TPA: uroporphyrinogen decarboxylase family protein [Candidatus Methylomirabilis sp.]|nr:uroporphyrinogen decarboxylase family protein [Candidatus Methylomirabilis sp.]